MTFTHLRKRAQGTYSTSRRCGSSNSRWGWQYTDPSCVQRAAARAGAARRRTFAAPDVGRPLLDDRVEGATSRDRWVECRPWRGGRCKSAAHIGALDARSAKRPHCTRITAVTARVRRLAPHIYGARRRRRAVHRARIACHRVYWTIHRTACTRARTAWSSSQSNVSRRMAPPFA
jgi:hypothetical protein